MRRMLLVIGAVALTLSWSTRDLGAQEAELDILEIGAIAPDFELPGATRFGQLRDPVRLSDYRGKTVVLAFFFRVRTPG